MTRALVIGGTGFIGLAIVDALLESGAAVRVTRRRKSVTLLVRKRQVELVAASLDARAALMSAMHGVDVVFFAAGHYPRYSVEREAACELGVAGVRSVCEAAIAAGVPRLVYTSSTGILDTGEGVADERDVAPRMPEESVYRAVKWAMERELERHRPRLEMVSLLAGGCLGPGDLRVGTGGILVGVAHGVLPFFVDGVVPIADVADVARAHIAAARRSAAEPRYVVAGHCLRVRDLLERIVARFGGRVPPELDRDRARQRADLDERAAMLTRARAAVPRELVDLAVAGRPMSNALAARDLGFSPRPLEETLDRAHAWFNEIGFLRSAGLEEAS